MFRVLLRSLGNILATVTLGTILASILIRLAPGAGSDERELDPRLSAESVQRIRSEMARQTLPAFYAAYCQGLARGDLGNSAALGRPVRELLGERIPVTFRAAGAGLAISWLAAGCLALFSVRSRSHHPDTLARALSSTLLCLPAAALSLVALLFTGESGNVAVAAAGIALVVFPRLFALVRGILVQTQAGPHIDSAIARGITGIRLVIWHILAPSAAPLLALAGVSVTLAFGAAIPVEVVCDVPGIGQLAWQAALQRDFPLLINLSLIVCTLVAVSNALSEASAGLIRGEVR